MNNATSDLLKGPQQSSKYLAYAGNYSTVFAAGVICQKGINQTHQQALVHISAQVNLVNEAQFGFATNDERDTITA